MMEKLPKNDEQTEVKTEQWVKPEIVSFVPAKAAEGIAYRPTDGFSNLT